MKIFELFGWHLFKARHDANGKTKAIIVEGVRDEQPKIRGRCPECKKTVYPAIEPGAPSITQGYVRYRLSGNWTETGNILLMLNCRHCNWVGECWFTLVEVR